jgi:hypothetical protein
VLRKTLCDLGHAGAQSGRPIAVRGTTKLAADWLVEHKVAAYNASGQLVLHSSSLVFKTCLGNPSLVQEPTNTSEQSLWSLRRTLKRQGWEAVGSARDASAEHKKFNSCSTSSMYLAILLDRTLPKTLFLEV